MADFRPELRVSQRSAGAANAGDAHARAASRRLDAARSHEGDEREDQFDEQQEPAFSMGSLARVDQWLRYLGPLLVSAWLLVMSLAGQLLPEQLSLPLALVVTTQVFVISELSRTIWWRLDRSLAPAASFRRRFLLQTLTAGAAVSGYALCLYVFLNAWQEGWGEWRQLSLLIVVAVAVSALFGLLLMLLRSMDQWRSAERHGEILKREALDAQLEALRSQVNPHFLFNSLNAVYGVIAEDPKAAQSLLLKLSEVFRYVLKHSATELVPLSEEIRFTQSYLDLLRARHDASIELDTSGVTRIADLRIPPLTLQLLAENAAKHNIVDATHPLRVELVLEDDRLVVRNERAPRILPSSGSGKGLENIRRRFAMLGAEPIQVLVDEVRFEVRLPLIWSA